MYFERHITTFLFIDHQYKRDRNICNSYRIKWIANIHDSPEQLPFHSFDTVEKL